MGGGEPRAPPGRRPGQKSDRLELLDDERFGKACAGPFLECRQRHHRIEIMPRFAPHLDRIGAKAMHHRRKHRVRAAKRAEQERSFLAVTAGAIGPSKHLLIDHVAHSHDMHASDVTSLSNIGEDGRQLTDHLGVTLKLSSVNAE